MQTVCVDGSGWKINPFRSYLYQQFLLGPGAPTDNRTNSEGALSSAQVATLQQKFPGTFGTINKDEAKKWLKNTYTLSDSEIAKFCDKYSFK